MLIFSITNSRESSSNPVEFHSRTEMNALSSDFKAPQHTWLWWRVLVFVWLYLTMRKERKYKNISFFSSFFLIHFAMRDVVAIHARIHPHDCHLEKDVSRWFFFLSSSLLRWVSTFVWVFSVLCANAARVSMTISCQDPVERLPVVWIKMMHTHRHWVQWTAEWQYLILIRRYFVRNSFLFFILFLIDQWHEDWMLSWLNSFLYRLQMHFSKECIKLLLLTQYHQTKERKESRKRHQMSFISS